MPRQQNQPQLTRQLPSACNNELRRLGADEAALVVAQFKLIGGALPVLTRRLFSRDGSFGRRVYHLSEGVEKMHREANGRLNLVRAGAPVLVATVPATSDNLREVQSGTPSSPVWRMTTIGKKVFAPWLGPRL